MKGRGLRTLDDEDPPPPAAPPLFVKIHEPQKGEKPKMLLLLCLILALCCFLITAIGGRSYGRIDVMGLGLVFLTIAFLSLHLKL